MGTGVNNLGGHVMGARYLSGWVTAWTLVATPVCPVFAQSAEVTPVISPSVPLQPVRICGAAWVPGSEDGQTTSDSRTVQALCWGSWLVLGQADTFQVSANPDLQATVVALKRSGGPTVLLLRPDQEGRPFIEDMTSVLAQAAGRTLSGTLEGLEVDLDHFALSGLIALVPGDSMDTPQAKAADDDLDGGGLVEAAQPPVFGPVSFEVSGHISQDLARLSLDAVAEPDGENVE